MAIIETKRTKCARARVKLRLLVMRRARAFVRLSSSPRCWLTDASLRAVRRRRATEKEKRNLSYSRRLRSSAASRLPPLRSSMTATATAADGDDDGDGGGGVTQFFFCSRAHTRRSKRAVINIDEYKKNFDKTSAAANRFLMQIDANKPRRAKKYRAARLFMLCFPDCLPIVTKNRVLAGGVSIQKIF